MKRVLFPMGCLMALLLACTHEPDEHQPVSPDSGVHEWGDSTISGDATMAMQFSLGRRMYVERTDSTATRVTADTEGRCSVEKGDLVNISVTGKGLKQFRVDDADNGSLECLAAEPFYWKSKAEKVTLQAWGYDNKTTPPTEPTSYTLETNQRDNGYKELLCSAVLTCSFGNIDIPLHHQMARVVLNLTHGKGTALSVSSITIGDGTTAVIPTTGTFSRPTGSNATGAWSGIGTEKGVVTPRTETANTCYSAVLIPCTYAAGTKLVNITTPDGSFSYELASAITLTAGNQYTFTINVNDNMPISNVTISTLDDVTYSGTAYTPKPVVKDGTRTLVEGTHYTLSYANNKNAGTATVTVTGIHAYAGTKSTTFNIKPLVVGTFDYKNSAQTFTTSKKGTYLIECWGASGGDAILGSTASEDSFGTGGYVAGQVALNSSQTLYIYTGQQGNATNVYSASLMFNGGGNCDQSATSKKCGACGGGATDVRTTGGNWDNATSLASRIIIAAGGGGGNYPSSINSSSCAGGLTGYHGDAAGKDGSMDIHVDYYQYFGNGGTQTAGGAVPNKHGSSSTTPTAGTLGKGGKGAASQANTPFGGGSGGGGGLYGGSGSSGLSNGLWMGGGGSSYISGHTGCAAPKSLAFTNTVMIDGAGYQWTNTKGSRVGMPSVSNASVIEYGHLGNGYCRISMVGD